MNLLVMRLSFILIIIPNNPEINGNINAHTINNIDINKLNLYLRMHPITPISIIGTSTTRTVYTLYIIISIDFIGKLFKTLIDLPSRDTMQHVNEDIKDINIISPKSASGINEVISNIAPCSS